MMNGHQRDGQSNGSTVESMDGQTDERTNDQIEPGINDAGKKLSSAQKESLARINMTLIKQDSQTELASQTPFENGTIESVLR